MSYMFCSKWRVMLTKMLHLWCILMCLLSSVESVSHPRCQGPLALLCGHLLPLIYLCFSRFVLQYDILDRWPPVTDAFELLDNQWIYGSIQWYNHACTLHMSLPYWCVVCRCWFLWWLLHCHTISSRDQSPANHAQLHKRKSGRNLKVTV